jgi:hypothetical protein
MSDEVSFSLIVLGRTRTIHDLPTGIDDTGYDERN